jgi:hypothetical protein
MGGTRAPTAAPDYVPPLEVIKPETLRQQLTVRMMTPSVPDTIRLSTIDEIIDGAISIVSGIDNKPSRIEAKKIFPHYHEEMGAFFDALYLDLGTIKINELQPHVSSLQQRLLQDAALLSRALQDDAVDEKPIIARLTETTAALLLIGRKAADFMPQGVDGDTYQQRLHSWYQAVAIYDLPELNPAARSAVDMMRNKYLTGTIKSSEVSTVLEIFAHPEQEPTDEQIQIIKNLQLPINEKQTTADILNRATRNKKITLEDITLKPSIIGHASQQAALELATAAQHLIDRHHGKGFFANTVARLESQGFEPTGIKVTPAYYRTTLEDIDKTHSGHWSTIASMIAMVWGSLVMLANAPAMLRGNEQALGFIAMGGAAAVGGYQVARRDLVRQWQYPQLAPLFKYGDIPKSVRKAFANKQELEFIQALDLDNPNFKKSWGKFRKAKLPDKDARKKNEHLPDYQRDNLSISAADLQDDKSSAAFQALFKPGTEKAEIRAIMEALGDKGTNAGNNGLNRFSRFWLVENVVRFNIKHADLAQITQEAERIYSKK